MSTHLSSDAEHIVRSHASMAKDLFTRVSVQTARQIFLSDSDFLSDIGKELVQYPMRSVRRLESE